MEKTTHISLIQKKAFHSTLLDGISEIFQGFLLFLVGFLFFNIYTEIGITILIIVLHRCEPKITQNLKTKIIYPRIGYVEWAPDHQRKLKNYWITFTCINISTAFGYVLAVYLSSWSVNSTLIYFPIIIGGIVLGRAIYFYIFTGHRSYFGLGAMGLGLAIFTVVFPFKLGFHHIVFYGFSEGIFLICIGLIKLCIFLRKNPILEPDINSSVKYGAEGAENRPDEPDDKITEGGFQLA